VRARLLVVEDDEDIRSVMSEALESEGYEVARACDGGDALRCARQRRPDLILLDLMMPRMDGWTFRAEQQADEALSDIPVVIVSAIAPADAAGLGAAAHLQKPFDLDDLMAVVARHRPSRRDEGPARLRPHEHAVARPAPGADARRAGIARSS
jgi:two-component system, chemotaxis family, chemotaxis protein CheY